MALFRKSEPGSGKNPQKTPTLPNQAYCRICRAERVLTNCWRRNAPLRQCECCGMAFENPAALYNRSLPVCPKCEEFLEQPGFEYGTCDGCGSKFELVSGTLPGLLPNRAQREAMNKIGRMRSQS